jgi:Ankyrin repeats (3 copies)/Ankyrin repeat
MQPQTTLLSPRRLDPILSVLREPPLPRMRAHDELDRALISALDGDDASGALHFLFRGASLKAPLPQRLAHERAFTIGDRFKSTDMLSPQSAQMIKQFEEMVEALRDDRSFDPLTWTSSKGFKMIHLGAAANDSDATKALLEAGANPNEPSRSQRTPLSYAAEWNCMATLGLLLDDSRVRKEVDLSDTGQMTPLSWAASGSASLACDALLRAGADVHSSNHLGFTPLHQAATANSWDSCVILISHGGQIDAKSKDGKSVEDWATESGNHNLVVQMVALDRASKAMKAIDGLLDRELVQRLAVFQP